MSRSPACFRLRGFDSTSSVVSGPPSHLHCCCAYFDKSWKECSEDTATFYRRYQRASDTSYLVQDFYISGVTQMTANSRTFRDPLEMTGRILGYWENGRVSWSTGFLNGKRHGLDSAWNEAGRLIYLREYDQGVKVGRWTRWSASGAVEEEGSYVNGEKEGLWISNHDEKTPEEKILYRAGKRLRVETWYRNGVKESEGALDSEAMRAVSLIPKWKPAGDHNRSIDCWVAIPVRFELR